MKTSKKPLESTFRKKVWAFLKVLPKSHWFAIQQVALIGHPDYVGCVDGQWVSLELKRDEKAKRAPLQNYNVAKVRSAGGMAEFIYPENWEATKACLMTMAGTSLS